MTASVKFKSHGGVYTCMLFMLLRLLLMLLLVTVTFQYNVSTVFSARCCGKH